MVINSLLEKFLLFIMNYKDTILSFKKLKIDKLLNRQLHYRQLHKNEL